MFTGEDWRDDASCRGMGPDLFFSDHRVARDAAARVCESCPVRVECLDEGLSRNEVGMWGGTNTHNRRTLRETLKTRGPAAFEDMVDRIFDPPDRSLAPATPERPCPRCDSIQPAREAGDPPPEDLNLAGAECGFPSTYNRGCRCLVCSMAKADYVNQAKRSPRGEDAKLSDVQPISNRRTA